MDQKKQYGFSTRAVHSGRQKDAYGALSSPVYRTATFEFESCRQGADIFSGVLKRSPYSRLGNPTVAEAEAKLADLEGGEAGLGCASGMGAISSTLWTLVRAGDRVVADRTLYGCTHELISRCLPEFGVETVLIDTSDEAALKAALTENTKAVYLEDIRSALEAV